MTKFMIDNVVRIVAGSFVVISTFLGIFVSEYFLIFTLFVGLNLFQYGFTNFCPLSFVLKRFGFEE